MKNIEKEKQKITLCDTLLAIVEYAPIKFS